MYGIGDGAIGCDGDGARVWQRRYDAKTDGKEDGNTKWTNRRHSNEGAEKAQANVTQEDWN